MQRRATHGGNQPTHTHSRCARYGKGEGCIQGEQYTEHAAAVWWLADWDASADIRYTARVCSKVMRTNRLTPAGASRTWKKKRLKSSIGANGDQRWIVKPSASRSFAVVMRRFVANGAVATLTPDIANKNIRYSRGSRGGGQLQHRRLYRPSF